MTPTSILKHAMHYQGRVFRNGGEAGRYCLVYGEPPWLSHGRKDRGGTVWCTGFPCCLGKILNINALTGCQRAHCCGSSRFVSPSLYPQCQLCQLFFQNVRCTSIVALPYLIPCITPFSQVGAEFKQWIQNNMFITQDLQVSLVLFHVEARSAQKQQTPLMV